MRLRKRFGIFLILTVILTSVIILGIGSTAYAASFTNPIVPSTYANGAADPWVVFMDGYYYYCKAAKNNSISVAKVRRLQDIGIISMTTVWKAPTSTMYSKEIWAPEIHYINGKWYIYFAADDGTNANHRMYCLESNTQDAQGTYTFKGKVADSTNAWAIDGTVLQNDSNGSLYFIWSGWQATDGSIQRLYIAAMSNPWTISGNRVEISLPTYDWEKKGSSINEGPQILKKNGKVHIIYSASGSWTDDYCLGQLTNTDGNYLNPSSWIKKSTPVFTKSASSYGVGHASFVKSPDGKEDWIVYHAMQNSGGGWSNRSARAQNFTWNSDSSPNFGTPLPFGSVLQEPSGTPDLAPCYFMIVNRNSGKTLDLVGGNTADGSRINQWSYEYTSANQRFIIRPTGDGHFNILHAGSMKAACIAGPSMDNSAQLHLWGISGAGGTDQQWDFIDAGNGWYKIKNVYSGKLLEVGNGATENDAKVNQYEDNGTAAQQWRLQPWGDYFIRADSGKYVCVENKGWSDGDRIIQYDYQNNPWFKWRFENVGDGWYKLSSLNNINSCISIKDASTDLGAGAVLLGYNGGSNQKIRIEPQANGEFKLYFAHTGMAWDIPSGQTGNNVPLQQYTAKSNPWQDFILERTSISDPVPRPTSTPTPTPTSTPKPTATPTLNEYSISGYIAPDFIYSQDLASTILQGFTVKIQGASNIVITDSKGYFELKGIKGGQSSCTLEISKNGYLKRLVANVIINKNLQIGSQTEPISMWAGDINQDGVINMADIMETAKAFNAISGSTLYNEDLDLNKDTAINMQDIMIVAKYFNKITSDYPTLTINTNTPTPTQQVTFTNTPTPTSKPTPTSTPVNGNYPTWDSNAYSYAIGDKVIYNGSNYECIMAHTSNTAWDPVSTLQVLWKKI